MECGSSSDANIDLSKSLNPSLDLRPTGKNSTVFFTYKVRMKSDYISMKQLFKKSSCTSIRVKEEGTCKQIRRGKVIDLSLDCNWNFPEESSLQRTSWSG